MVCVCDCSNLLSKLVSCLINRQFIALLELLFQAAFRCREEIAALDLQVSPASIDVINFYLQ